MPEVLCVVWHISGTSVRCLYSCIKVLFSKFETSFFYAWHMKDFQGNCSRVALMSFSWYSLPNNYFDSYSSLEQYISKA